jgi:excisionase family DNA binding protein
MKPDWVKSAEACALLGVTRDVLERLEADGVLPAWRPHPKAYRRWDRAVLLAYAEQARAQAGASSTAAAQ